MNKEIQEKYMEYQMIAEQIQELQKQIQALSEKQTEVLSVIESLDELKNTKEGKEILFPISSGIFAKAKIQNTYNLLVNVGGNIVVSKDIEGAKKLLQENIEDIKQTQVTITAQTEKFAEKAQALEKELEAASKNV